MKSMLPFTSLFLFINSAPACIPETQELVEWAKNSCASDNGHHGKVKQFTISPVMPTTEKSTYAVNMSFTCENSTSVIGGYHFQYDGDLLQDNENSSYDQAKCVPPLQSYATYVNTVI